MKNLISQALFLALLLVIPDLVYSQNEKVVEAFTQSYDFEKNTNYQQAISALESVYADDSYEINIRLGWLYYKAGNYLKSQDYYSNAINLMPYSIESKLGYNLPASALNNWDNVVEMYKNILEIDPQNTFVNYQLGNIYYERKDYAAAYSCFEKVVNLYPFDYDSVLMFAWTNLQLGKLRESKILFGKTLLISPASQSALDGMKLVK